MKERGLLMTSVNYGRCKDGSKTQTRRIMEFQPGADATWYAQLRTSGKDSDLWFPMKGDPKDVDCWEQAEGKVIKCPYGEPGDRLYVKEGLKTDERIEIKYRRDGEIVNQASHAWEWQKNYLSPLHMPRWAARLWLELTDVRVERLHEISSADVRAEGVEVREFELFGADSAQRTNIHRLHFKQLWESNAIHKPGSWDFNPWLWVLTFTKVPA